MVQMNPRGFSRMVLSGAQARGLTLTAIRRATGVSGDRLISVLDGRREFTERQLERIESIARLSRGQLAALSLEPQGGPLTEITDVLASARQSLSKASRSERARKTKGRSRVVAASTH
jgi:hypothetical protein